MLIILVVAAVMVATTSAFPSGPPGNLACEKMTPFHNYTLPQTTPAPYAISVNTSNCYKPGQAINVTLSSNDNRTLIAGFFMQARKPNEAVTSYGRFSAAGNRDVSPVSCVGDDNNGMGHNRIIDKTSTQFVWIAPDLLTDNVVLTTTVVEEFDVFWVQGVNLTLSLCIGGDTTSTSVKLNNGGTQQTRMGSNAATLLTVAVLYLLVSAFNGRRC